MIACKIAIAAGKGGVGKSSICMSLASSLQAFGYAVGVLDADLYGPSLAQMMPLDKPITRCPEEESFFYPGEWSGIKIFSIGHLKDKGEPLIVRAPIINGLLLQCKKQIIWGELDYLLVDFPPGTGDVQLTLLQEMLFSGAVLVTLPQQISVLEVLKTAAMFLQVKVPILGIIENMSYFQDPVTHKKLHLFEGQGGEELAKSLNVPLFGRLPIDPLFCSSADQGTDFQKLFPKSLFTKEMQEITAKMQEIIWNQPLQEEVQEVRLFCSSTLLLILKGGAQFLFTLADLQKECPCKACQDEAIEPLLKDVEATKIAFVGNYAIRLDYTSGCSKGIYAFSLLKQLVQKIGVSL